MGRLREKQTDTQLGEGITPTYKYSVKCLKMREGGQCNNSLLSHLHTTSVSVTHVTDVLAILFEAGVHTMKHRTGLLCACTT